MQETEGFCGECRRLEHAPAQEANATECGHRTAYAGMRWCAACAIMKGICRRCGAFTRHPAPTERPGGADD
jgi:hypothetical protein